MPVSVPPAQTPVGQVICTVAGAYSFVGTKAATATTGNNTTRAAPLFVPEPVTLDRIGIEVTTIGEAGSVVRLGIWADAGTMFPGTLVLDAGTVAGDSAGVKEITISQSLSTGYYWLSATAQSAPTTQPTLRIASETVGASLAASSASASAAARGLSRTDAGALPSSWGTGLGNIGNIPRVLVRVV